MKLLRILTLMLILAYPDAGYNPVYGNAITSASSTKHPGKICFLGSSRINLGIHLETVRNNFPESKIEKTGIPAAQFTACYLLAEQIMQHAEKNTLIIIELNRSNLKHLPKETFYSENHSFFDTFKSVVRLISWGGFQIIYPAFICLDDLLFHHLNFRNFFKKSTGNADVQATAGKEHKYTNQCKTIVSMLEKKDLIQPEIKSTASHLTTICKNFHAIAAGKNITIWYMLPVAFKDYEEKNSLLKLYHSLPANMKLEYPGHFIDSIRNSIYLYDRFHLNIYGARIYSGKLSLLIKEKLKNEL